MCEGSTTAPPLILIVDDDAEWRAALRSLLEHSGYRVIEAENGEVALRVARERNPDLVLLDFAMPVLDGFETASRLRRDGGPPLLAVSGEELTPAQDRNMRALFDGYVKKPAATELLRKRIAVLLRRRVGREQSGEAG